MGLCADRRRQWNDQGRHGDSGLGGATYSTANGYGPSGSFGITNKDQSNGLSLGGAVSGLNGTPAATGYIAVEIKHVTVKIIGGFKNGHLYPLTVAVDLGPNHTDINNALAIATGVASLVMNPIPSAIAIGFRIAQKLFGNKLPSWLGGKKKSAAKPAAGAAPGKSPAAPTSGAAAPVVATPTPAPSATSAGGGGGNAGVALLLTEQDLTDNPNLFVASDARWMVAQPQPRSRRLAPPQSARARSTANSSEACSICTPSTMRRCLRTRLSTRRYGPTSSTNIGPRQRTTHPAPTHNTQDEQAPPRSVFVRDTARPPRGPLR